MLISCGTLSLIIGLCGLFTPGLPTTPFILLTGTLYAKSSPTLYKRLENNKLTGAYLRRMENGLSWKARLFSISLMWCMVCITAFLVFDNNRTMKFVMLGLGVIGTIAQLIALRKKKTKKIVEQIPINTVKTKDIDTMNI